MKAMFGLLVLLFLGYLCYIEFYSSPTVSKESAVKGETIAEARQKSAQSRKEVEIFKNLRAGMSYSEAEEIVGKPDDEIGSGMYIYRYSMADGTNVVLGFVDLDHLLYAKHQLKNGADVDLIPEAEQQEGQ